MSTSVLSLSELAERSRSCGQLLEAIELFSQSIKACLNDKGCYNDEKKLAKLYNERGFTKYLYVDFDGAVDDYTRAIEYDDTSHVFYYNRALVHYRLARFRLAVDDTNAALKLKPNFEDAVLCQQQAIIDGKLEEGISQGGG